MNKKIKNILKFVVPIIIVYLIISSIYIFAHIGIGTAQSLGWRGVFLVEESA